MTERKSFITLRGFETPASRLTAELNRLKIKPETVMLSGLDTPGIESLGNSLRMASSLANFPDPLVLIDLRSGKALLINNAAVERFAEIRTRGLDHAALEGWKQAGPDLEAGKAVLLPDYQFLGRAYERKLSVHEGLLQVLFREKREPQIFYPFPVIDYTAALGFVNVRNDAARRAFPHIEGHPILGGIKEAVPGLRRGTLRAINDTIASEGRIWRRSAVYIASSDVIRIFASDVTDAVSQSKSLLLAMCAKVEKCNSSAWARQDLLELDRMARDVLAAIKSERADLGAHEREVLRLSYLSGRFTEHEPRPDELESFKSVISLFVQGLKL